VDEENSARSTSLGRIELDVQSIGDRPFGQTRVDSPIVQIASAVAQRFGLQPRYSAGSTDANIPMSMRIPSITVDSGGVGGRVHTPDEWIDVEKNSSVKGIQLLLSTVVGLAGLP
jgi:di/tripeptidase